MSLPRGTTFRRALMAFIRSQKAMVERIHIMAMERVFTDDIPTAATDGKVLLINLDWIEKLHHEEIMGVLAHEARHRMLCHHLRFRGMWQKARTIQPDITEEQAHNLFNVACDMRINNDLIMDGWKLPSNGVFDTQGKYFGWAAERIFFDLLKHQEGGKSGPAWGLVMPASGTEAEHRTEEREIQRDNRMGAIIAMNQGRLPGSLKELVDVKSPIPDWDKRLADTLSRAVGGDEFSMARISNAGRRMGIVLPGTIGTVCEHILIALDTSGSISAKEMGMFLSKSIAVCRAEQPERITIIQCDANVQSVDEIKQGDEPPRTVTIKGRGGTDFRPVFDHIRQQNWTPTAILYFTDMCGRFPSGSDFPTIWMSTSDIVGPFGETIRIGSA